MRASQYDVAVIGAGPGGYVAAIRCAQLGLRVVCIDDRENEQGAPALGGTCLQVGCIPSKALLESSWQYHRCRTGMQDHGIVLGEVGLDLDKMMARKSAVVNKLGQGVAGLFRKNRIEFVLGRAELAGAQKIRVTGADQEQEINAGHIILATGSRPASISSVAIDGKQIVNSTGALSFDRVPKRLGIIGAGAIGLELGSVWGRLGSQVMIVEAMETFLPQLDDKIGKMVLKELRKQGIGIELGAMVSAAEKGEDGVTLSFEKGGQTLTHTFDRLLCCVGRTPNSDSLGLDGLDIKTDGRGFVEVNDQCRTSVPNIYAIGDLVRGPMLAHKASEEARLVAGLIAGGKGAMELDRIPCVVYTSPEVAWVGQSAQALREQGIQFRSGMFHLAASGRALASGEATGAVSIHADQTTDRILGVHVFAPHASELIAEAVLAMEFEGSAEDLYRTIHAHPSLSESLQEAAFACHDQAVHQ